MKILEIIGTLNPTFGGPVEGVREMSKQLRDMGHSVEVVCADPVASSWIENFPVKVHALGPSFFKYCFNFVLIKWLLNNSNKYDVLIVNGVWQFHSFATYLASKSTKIPYFIYTHGMLDPWFKNAFPIKHIKKQIYWLLAEYWVIKNAKNVIFTTEEERQLAKSSFVPYTSKGVVINFGIRGCKDFSNENKDLFFRKYPQLIGKKCILFLSRIHHKKGCDLLIKAFSSIYKNDDSYHLVIVGNDQEGLRTSFEKLAENLGTTSRINWTGMVSDDMKWSCYHACEVFMLPSHSENFGSAVVEALSVGKPVLITNKVNIWREIASHNAGIVENDDLEGAIKLLSKWSLIGAVKKREMEIAAQKCFKDLFEIESAAENLSEHLITVLYKKIRN
ncbi:glycosyltransferase [Polynucleobacter paneuropaeus]|nr:glycosyltransferase [Polynucleobacter paneuropaeus]MBT8599721.1 glycosyltransferase [Polynucleobacter paneuropaeus]